MDAGEEIVDVEAMGIRLFGLSVADLKKVLDFYKMRTGDVDCERIDFFTKNL
jgi:hypothetical protein